MYILIVAIISFIVCSILILSSMKLQKQIKILQLRMLINSAVIDFDNCKRKLDELG